MNASRIALIAAAGGLSLTGCTTVREAVVEAIAGTHHATLSSSEVVGTAGDSDGYATAELTVADALDQMCYDVNDLRNVGTITRGGIYRGGMGSVGTPVIWLKQNETGDWKNCVNKSEWLENSIDRNPANYYIQIDTSTGSIRGQFR